MTVAQRKLYCFGLGDSATRLARRMLAQGWSIGGTVRSAQKAGKMAAEGINACVWPGSQITVPQDAVWLVSVPPDAYGCPVVRNFGQQARAARVIYLSTTGVYGDLAGGWAFEWSAPAPSNIRGARRWLAEQQWQAAARRLASVRLPGIYGPGRSALDRVRSGKARRIIKPGQVFSRVHVDDIVSGLAALLEHDTAPGVWHLCDDEPAPPEDVIVWAADRLGLARPPAVDFATAQLSEMARSFYDECKRVSNARAKSALGWRPAFPDYRTGLEAILAGED